MRSHFCNSQYDIEKFSLDAVEGDDLDDPFFCSSPYNLQGYIQMASATNDKKLLKLEKETNRNLTSTDEL
ncbi:hypothetical protein P8452_19179 [Trifolium repens]|jgi:hypothetical protein|nr:hypothetical protein P8452_19179 [Trifolium repens]